MSSNILEVLRIADKEDAISNLLAYCIERSTSFRNTFLERICGFEAAAYSDCRVYPRMQVPNAGVPDLVIVCKGRTTDWAIIENKLKAEEGRDQTERYADPKTKAALSKRLGLGESAGQPKLVFLTLFPDQIPESQDFTRACYSSLLQDPPHPDQGDGLARQLASAWFELLEEFYASENLDPDEVFAEKLSRMPALDGGYLAFGSLIRDLSLPSGLAPDHFFRKSERGRKYYGAALVKPEWRIEPFDDSARQWTLPEGNRRIHIEPQYDVLSRALKVYIHYETNPYYPVRRLQERVPPDQYEAYLTRREAFAKYLSVVDIAPFQVRVYSNQLASATVSLGGSKVAEVQQQMQKLVQVAAEVIDRALAAESAD